MAERGERPELPSPLYAGSGASAAGASPTSARRDLRAVLLRAAEEEILEVGVRNVSLRAIARRAGVSHQAPGHAFGDRAGLLTAVAGAGHVALGEAMRAGYDGARTEDPVRRLTAFAVAYVRFATTRRALFAAIARPELTDLSDPGLTECRAGPLLVLDNAIAEAVATGWGRGVDPRVLAWLCRSAVHGVASFAVDGTMEADTAEGVAAELCRTLIAALDGPPLERANPAEGHQLPQPPT